MLKKTWQKGVRLLLVLGMLMVMLGPPSAMPIMGNECPPPGTGSTC